MGNLSCGNLDPPPSSGGQSAASSPSALHEDGLTKRFRRCRSPFREPPKSHRHPVGMVIAIISESRSGSVRNRDRHHLGTLIAIARNTQNWLRNEIDDSAKAHELRIKEATDFVTAYALNELTPDNTYDRFLRYGHRWGEALPGTYAYSHSTNEQIIQAIDNIGRASCR